MEIFDKKGKRIRQKRTERKATGEAPDVILKPVKKIDRKNLPPKVKVVFFCLLNAGYVSQEIFEDCFKSHPEYFETKKSEDEKEN